MQSIVRACHAVKDEFHRDAKALPYADFVIRREDVRENMGDMCFAQKMAAYRYSHMGFREDTPPPADRSGRKTAVASGEGLVYDGI
ncbi:MAG: hypothetical protein PGN08_10830 [Sphingomonas taxi]